jgi:hypothetical protein
MATEVVPMLFKPRRSPQAVKVVVALTAALLVFSVWVLFLSAGGFALSMVALTALIVGLILVDTARIGWYYSVEEDGIRIKRSFKRYRIAGEQIAEVRDIGGPKVRSIMRRAQEGKTRAGGKAPSGGKVNRQVELGRIIGFSSVPISLGKGGSAAAGQAAGAGLPAGRFVLVVRRDGRQYLLSPRQPEEFVRACRKAGLGS